MNRSTCIGWAWRLDPQAATAELRAIVEQHDGNLSAAARDLDITRRHLYRLLQRANLLDVVEASRARSEPIPDEIRRAREALAQPEECDP